MIFIQKRGGFIILLLIVSAAVSFVFCYSRNGSESVTDAASKSRRGSVKQGPSNNNQKRMENTDVKLQKKKFRSAQEWAAWLRSEGGWQVMRDGVAGFKGDRQAFKEIGISGEEYDEIFGGVSSAVWAVWGGSPDRIYTEGDTTVCIYNGNSKLDYIYGRFMSNLTRNLKGISEKKQKDGIETEPVDPLLLEAIIEICRKEPILRNFGLAKLETSFQDIVQDGKSIFRVVEKLYDTQGNIVTQTEYMSPRIPEPYSDELWIEEEQ